jgi:hypothetical protein
MMVRPAGSSLIAKNDSHQERPTSRAKILKREIFMQAPPLVKQNATLHNAKTAHNRHR